MLTPLGRLLALGIFAVLLIVLTSYLFVFTRTGPDFVCQRRAGCVVIPR